MLTTTGICMVAAFVIFAITMLLLEREL